MASEKGVYITARKDGTPSYRASITYNNKHISLGSFSKEKTAHDAYLTARDVVQRGDTDIDGYSDKTALSYNKWVILHNFRDNGYYFKTPVYLHRNYFTYHLSPDIQLYFDVDDLFYYTCHTIHKRGGYLYVNDYGMQVNILNRYGIANHSVQDRDYRFIDGDANNLRYDNIQVMNPYHGIIIEKKEKILTFKARINLNGYYIIGRYRNIDTAAIAYNAAVDFVQHHGISNKTFVKNFITHMNSSDYNAAYKEIQLNDRILLRKRD